METFLTIIVGFPTVIYTVLLAVMGFYWLIAAFGLVDIDVLDLDLDTDIDIDTDVDFSPTNLEGIAGLLVTLGLTGVPLTIILTLITMTAWIATYFIAYLINGWFISSFVSYLVGGAVILIAFGISIPVTANVIKPLKPLFAKAYATENVERELLGRAVKVRSSKVDNKFGEAVFVDGGTNLILKVRCDEGRSFAKGDTARIIEFNEIDKTYLIVSTEEFGEV